jgi:hypothetical protein
MDNNSKTITQAEEHQLKLRALQAKSKVIDALKPATEYIHFFIRCFPELNNDEEKARLRGNWNLRRVDEDIIKKMELLPELIKNNGLPS